MAQTLSKNRITKARYDDVMFHRVCPKCGNFKVVDVPRKILVPDPASPGTQKAKYLGTFHGCDGFGQTGCGWHMTKFVPSKPNKPLYETF